MTRHRPARGPRRPVVHGALGLLLAGGLAACATRAPRDAAGPVRPSGQGGAPASPGFGRAYESLVAASHRAGTPAPHAPIPPGLEPGAVAPLEGGTPAHAKAVEPLRPLMARLIDDATPVAVQPRPVSAEDRIAALRLYASGREHLVRGDFRGAAEDLMAATQADPGAPQPWRELGEAHAALGALLEAESAYQAAVDRGLHDARVFEFLARAALAAGHAEDAAGLFGLAGGADPADSDPALPMVIFNGLGRALLEAGYLGAGCEALSRALQLPERPPAPTRYANELGAIYRRQGDAWREIGDAWARLGRFEDALTAYLRSAALPAMDAQDISARIFYAAARAGRPAAAAVFVLERIRGAGGRASREDAAVLRGLVRDPGVGRLTARALDELADSLGPSAPPTVLGGLARARAAALPPPDAAGVLRGHLRRQPADAASAAELFLLSNDRVAEAARLVAAAPNYADRYADALARASTDAPGTLREVLARRDDAARLLSVYFQARTQGNAAAWARLDGFSASGAIGLEAEAARARLAAALGRWAEAERALDRLAALPVTPASARARARALWATRRAEQALEALRPALEATTPPSERLDDLLLAAELGMRLGKVEQVESWLGDALSIDPGDDRSYALLLGLHGPSGPKPDTDRLGEALRQLRDAWPDSRLLAFIRAQEFIRRGFYSQAERELERLAAPDPTDPAVIELLCTVWTRANQRPDSPQLTEALRYLDEQHTARPWSDTLLSARARVLAAAGRADQAEALLRTRLASGGAPELSRLLEGLLRQRGKSDEADRLAVERLSAPERSIDESLEWIELLVAQERDGEVAAALRDGVPPWVVLDASQGDRVQAAIGAVVARAVRSPDAPREPALEALDEAVRRRIRLAPELHDRRIALLTAAPDADPDRLIAAADDAARDHPALGSAAYLRVAQSLVAADRGEAAVELMERAGARPDASVDVLEAWVLVVRTSGGAEQVRRVLDRAAALGRMGALVERLMPNRAAGEQPSWDPRSMMAYELALIRASEDREDEAVALYELALEYDPRHGWANNNLGYHLVERGEQLDRAERLLEAAIDALPDEASVIDSLGWLRYRLGVLQDSTDEAGRVAKQGAVRLLERAVRADQDRTRRSSRGYANQTILDHYGDALWAAGQKADAKRAWERAERAANRGAAEIRNTNPPGRDRLLREADTVRDAVQRKIQSVLRGEDPQIAPRAPTVPPAAPAPVPAPAEVPGG